jgi:hypothetical protein
MKSPMTTNSDHLPGPKRDCPACRARHLRASILLFVQSFSLASARVLAPVLPGMTGAEAVQAVDDGALEKVC